MRGAAHWLTITSGAEAKAGNTLDQRPAGGRPGDDLELRGQVAEIRSFGGDEKIADAQFGNRAGNVSAIV